MCKQKKQTHKKKCKNFKLVKQKKIILLTYFAFNKVVP